MPEQLWFTEILNRYLAAPVDSVLGALHITPAYPNAPINNFVAMEILVFGILFLFFVLVWEGWIEMDGKGIRRLLLLAKGSEKLRWANGRIGPWGEPDVTHLPGGHPIDLVVDCNGQLVLSRD